MSLTRIIGQRLAAVALGAMVLQTAYVTYEYGRNPDELIESVVERELDRLSDRITPLGTLTGEDWRALYAQFPTAYGFELRDAAGARLLAMNPELLEGLPESGPDQTEMAGGDHGGKRRYGIRRVVAKGVPFELRVATFGDPGNISGKVLQDEIRDHVTVPILPFTVLLALVLWVVLRRVLRPVEKAAAAAAALKPGSERLSIDLDGAPREVAALGEAVNTLLARLHEAHAAQSEFTANVAHELRTPLALLMLELDGLEGTAVEQARRDLRAMSRLIDQLLSLARLEAFGETARQDTGLAALAGAVVSRLAPLAIDKGLALELVTAGDGADAPPVVSGVPEAIAGALRNLIENAMRVAPQGSTITVEAGPGPRLAVRDHGPGIKAEDQASLFERYRQGDRKARGSAGLGLSIVKRTMELHGGTVRLQSTPGQGACFELLFPAQAPR